jgi:hypothetical protein
VEVFLAVEVVITVVIVSVSGAGHHSTPIR